MNKMRRGSVGIALLLVGLATDAWARDVEGKLGIGLRGGGAHLTQIVTGDLEGEFGPAANLSVFYGASPTLLFGVEVEWQAHTLNFDCEHCDIGNAVTVSVRPTAQFRNLDLGAFVPYLFVGLGVNVNRFNADEECPGCTIKAKNTVALKVGGGADYFVTPGLALNGEWGWSVNTSNADYSVAIGDRTYRRTDGYHLNAFSLLLGLRYFY